MFRIAPDQPQQPDPSQDQAQALPDQQDATSQPDVQAQPMKRFSVEKVDQSISGYMGPEYGPFMCANCEHFDGANACNIVSGNIDPEGCCNLFTPPDSHDQPEEQEAAPDASNDQDQPTEDEGSY